MANERQVGLSTYECELLTKEIQHIKQTVDEIKVKLDTQYVTKDQFLPVAKIAYGIVALLGIGLVGAIMKMVLK